MTNMFNSTNDVIMNDSSDNSTHAFSVSKPTGNTCLEMIPDGDDQMNGLYIDLKVNEGNLIPRNLEKEPEFCNSDQILDSNWSKSVIRILCFYTVSKKLNRLNYYKMQILRIPY